jgi:protein tyrosine phosphatase (PTP) superfamily phosphohydrolase (DUF442 family)
MGIESSHNFRKVNNRLTTSGSVRPDVLKTLSSQGYEVVVNLLPDSSEYAVAGEEGIVESQNIRYIYIPVDFKQPTRLDFTKFSQALDELQDRKVHLHCAANYRVSAFYSLYQVCSKRWSLEQATQFIEDVWQPAAYSGWAAFMADILADDTANRTHPDSR